MLLKHVIVYSTLVLDFIYMYSDLYLLIIDCHEICFLLQSIRILDVLKE